MDSNERANNGGSRFMRFASLGSNQAALQLARDFARGAVPFGLIGGAPGWGKSHLLGAAAESFRNEASVQMVSSIEIGKVQTLAKADVLIVDDLHLAQGQQKTIQRLNMELERRVRSKRPTLCSGDTSKSSFLRRVIPAQRRWQYALVEAPSFEEKLCIVHKMAEAEEIKLGDESAKLICNLVNGDGRSLLGALTRLRVAIGSDLRPHLPIRIAGALCPLLPEDDSFDLRAIVVDCVSQGLSLRLKRERPNISKMVSVQILRVQGRLPEPYVAEYFGLSNGDAFRMQKEAEQSLKSGDRPLTVGYERSMSLISRRLKETERHAGS